MMAESGKQARLGRSELFVNITKSLCGTTLPGFEKVVGHKFREIRKGVLISSMIFNSFFGICLSFKSENLSL